MKYIDAEKLIAGLKHLQEKFPVATYNATYHLIESLQQEQPPLSSNLDDAAQEYFLKTYGIDNIAISEDIKRAVKFGAEWMMRQGYTFETIMQEDDVDELVPTCPDMYNHGYSCGDKVIVQIRKKQ